MLPGMNRPLPHPDPRRRPVLIGSEIYRRSRYGGKHPLAIPRVSLTLDLIRALGWAPVPEAWYVDSPMATPEQLGRYHDPAYVQAVMDAERDQDLDPERRARFNLGQAGNPVFGEIFRRPATACGASIHAAGLLRHGGVVHSPAGGTHHGGRDYASGFCYFNDPVLAILAFLDQGLARVAYVDLDAHHGDGVEAAFAGDPRVLTISLHEADRWPRSGAVETTHDGTTRNFPLPAAVNDTEHGTLMAQGVLPLLQAFAPDALVLQSGADSLANDPMSKLTLSNNAYRHALSLVRDVAPRLLVLGGGGYNPYALARCWALLWADLNGHAVPATLPEAAQAVLAEVEWRHSMARNPDPRWRATLIDPPAPGPVRPVIEALIGFHRDRPLDRPPRQAHKAD